MSRLNGDAVALLNGCRCPWCSARTGSFPRSSCQSQKRCLVEITVHPRPDGCRRCLAWLTFGPSRAAVRKMNGLEDLATFLVACSPE
jgi:hypothetical protein